MDYEIRQELRDLISEILIPEYKQLRKQQKRSISRSNKKRKRTPKSSTSSTSSTSSSNSNLNASMQQSNKRVKTIKRPSPSTFTLNNTAMKRIKEIARRATCNILAVHELLQEPLTSNNSETRLMALLVSNELFVRSKIFRQAAVKQIKELVENTIGGRNGTELPLPTDAAQTLRTTSIAFFETWYLDYGIHFQALRMAHQYMSTSLNITFPKEKQQEIDQETARTERIKHVHLLKRATINMDRVALELQNGSYMEVKDHAVILENCLRMLIPGNGSFGERNKEGVVVGGGGGEKDNKEKVDMEKDEDDEDDNEDEDEWIDTSEPDVSKSDSIMNKKNEDGKEDDNDDDDDDDDSDYEGEAWSLYDNTSTTAMQALGITSEHFELKIRVSSIKAKIMEQTTDHRQYIEPTMRDAIVLTETRYTPMLQEWMQVFHSYIQELDDQRTPAALRAIQQLQELEQIHLLVKDRTLKCKELLNVKSKNVKSKSYVVQNNK